MGYLNGTAGGPLEVVGDWPQLRQPLTLKTTIAGIHAFEATGDPDLVRERFDAFVKAAIDYIAAVGKVQGEAAMNLIHAAAISKRPEGSGN